MRFRGLVYVLAGQRLCEHLAPPESERHTATSYLRATPKSPR